MTGDQHNPRCGDTVLVCPHVGPEEITPTLQWFKPPEPLPWIACCIECSASLLAGEMRTQDYQLRTLTADVEIERPHQA